MYSYILLPELELPIFHGDKRKWIEFWDLFQNTVDHNKHLSNIEKFIYLKSRLTGDAKATISGLFLSDDNHKIAKGLLKERFEDTQFILQIHFTELINLTPAVNNPKGLRLFYNQLECHLRSLEALQQDINHDIFTVIITSKIPKDVLVHLEMQKGALKKWSVTMLREQLYNYICAVESVEQQCCLRKGERKSESPMGASARQSEPHVCKKLFLSCRYCQGNHWNDNCLEYATAEDRKPTIKDNCFLCLRKGHIAYNCTINKSCYHCGRKGHHHRSLCPQKFAQNENIRTSEKTQRTTDSHGCSKGICQQCEQNYQLRA